MYKKELIRRTGRYTAEYRVTYNLGYRYEMPNRIIYFTQEAVDNAHLDNFVGHVVESSGDWQFGSSISPDRKLLLRSAISRGTLETHQEEVVFEYEVDYE